MPAADPAARTVGPEGELRVTLAVAGGRVLRCSLTSTRPDVAGGLLQGRKVGEILLAVPRLFSICGASQAAACELALAAAEGAAPTVDLLQRCSAAVAAETLRETARRVLLDWPRALGEAPSAEAIAGARAAAGPTPQSGAVARAVFGVAAADWLAQDTPQALHDWAAGGVTATARYLRAALALPASDSAPVPLLPSPPQAAWLQQVLSAAQADTAFARRPVWQGAPAETGALARGQADPLVAALLQGAMLSTAPGGSRRVARPVARHVARHVARLRELARLLDGHLPVAAGALALSAGQGDGDGLGVGVGWAENARGLLLHHVRVEHGRATLYRIMAPTEWNFHPDGALAAAALGMTAQSEQVLRFRMAQEIDSLDPCVSCEIQISDA